MRAKFDVSNLPKLLAWGLYTTQIVNEKLIAKWLDYAILLALVDDNNQGSKAGVPLYCRFFDRRTL
jgi:hypothetical protein